MNKDNELNSVINDVRAVFKCEEKFKKKFHQSHCLMTISVGQEVHEGDKFLAVVGLVNKAFRECTILVDDTLQRHTMQLEDLNATPEFLYSKSLKEGDLWLERNKGLYNQFKIPYRIIRWNEWLHHQNYKSTYEIIEKAYEINSLYRRAFHDTVKDFLSRYKNRLNNIEDFDESRAFELCLSYLKEECTALYLWAEGNYHFEVYPNKRNQVMTMTHDLFIKPKNDLLHPVAVKFKGRRQLKPQIFTTNKKETSE